MTLQPWIDYKKYDGQTWNECCVFSPSIQTNKKSTVVPQYPGIKKTDIETAGYRIQPAEYRSRPDIESGRISKSDGYRSRPDIEASRILNHGIGCFNIRPAGYRGTTVSLSTTISESADIVKSASPYDINIAWYGKSNNGYYHDHKEYDYRAIKQNKYTLLGFNIALIRRQCYK